jgi:DegV family protein with EDD domain
MGASTVAVVTDSAASLTTELVAEFGIFQIPVHLRIGDEWFLDIDKASDARVNAALNAHGVVTTTAASPAEIAAIYRNVARSGAESIVSIHVSSEYSAMLQNARQAATRSPLPVTFVDAGTTAMGQSLVVLAAAALAAAGRTADEVAGGALAVARSCRFLFTVESVEHLRRGGRVSAMVGAVGHLFNIRPVISIHDGDTTVVDRVHKVERARDVIRSSMELYASTLARPAACIGVPAGSTAHKDLTFSIRGPVLEVAVGGSLVAHTGPGTCGIAVADMPPEFAAALRARGGRDDT